MHFLHRFDPTPCRFPSPRLPVLPLPRGSSLGLWVRGPGPEDGRRFQHHARGRYALEAALACVGLRKGHGTLLLPAYHCRTMLDPAVAQGIRVQVYPLRPDLSPDLDALRTRLADLRGQPKALLLTHFFGFVQPELAAIQTLCEAECCELIEDASHAFVLDPSLASSPQLAPGLATTAATGIASPYKFLPSPDGGLLWTRGPLPVPPRPATWRAELRAWLHFGRALLSARSSRPPGAALEPVDGAGPALQGLEAVRSPSPRFLDGERGRAPLRISRWVQRHARVDRIASARRANYLRLSRGLSGLRHARALHPQLDEFTVPYMFPLLLEEAEPYFTRLKVQGLPIWRWDELLDSDCPTSQSYRQRLFHLPCHEGLGSEAVDWMVERLRHELSGAAA